MSGTITWKKLHERVERVGYRTVVHKRFIRPDGQEIDWTTTGNTDVVATIAFTPDRHTICVNQYRAGPEQVLTCLAGGFVEKSFTPLVAAQHELLEETGYQGELTLLGTIPLNGYSGSMQHVFLALDCQKVSDPQPGEDEFIELKLLDPLELLARVYAGKTDDAAAILLGLIEAHKRGLITLPNIGAA